MKTLIQILITILITATCTGVFAQGDTSKVLPLYRNAQAETIEGEQSVVKTDPYANDTIGLQLRQLQALYSAGKFHDALSLSHNIRINPHLNKAQNQDRLKYTIAAYKDLGYDREADSLARIFRKRDPFYQPRSIDPVAFRNVLNNYYTTPKFSVWAALGKTIAKTHNDTIRTIIDTVPDARRPEYDITGFVVQIGFEYRPFKIITISLAPSITSYNIYRTAKRTDIATFNYDENCQIFTLPVIVEAGLHFGREIIVPSIYASAQMKYIIRSEYTAYTDAIGTYTTVPDYKANTDFKNQLNYSLLGGIRLNYNRRRMTYFADLGMSIDMLPYNDPKKIYSNYDILYQHFHVPDVFQMIEYTAKIGIKVNLQYKTIAKNNYGY